MANDASKLLLSSHQEKTSHYTYLKEFRVEQCQSFLQHKCNQHRPFVCFNWHFQNQRRRRPVRKRDGTFNYSADNYCTKYDETTGICPEGDECPFLHRTAGDTERRYHLRYYKTCMCVHDTDSRGYCVKNGLHCAFAHGMQDQRPPVYDIKELETLQNSDITLDGTNAQNALDKERNLMNEDPKWQDTNYVLANYKTEPCKRPPRLCRQGYACPQYHNSKDKRRSPRKYKYRSTPCPNVKHGEEWGEPGNCESSDNCQYCHTRTEQQFHPEIYKSTKCNDVQQAGYCPRSVFCAFAHVEPYVVSDQKKRDHEIALSELISNGLSDLKVQDEVANGKLPPGLLQLSNNLLNDIDGNNTNKMLVDALENTTNSSKILNISLPMDSIPCTLDDPRENSLSASLVNNSLLTRSSAPINIPNTTLSNSINDFNSGGFAVNIPSSSLTYSPTNHANLFSVYGGSNKLSNSLSAATQNDSNSIFFPSRIISPAFGDGLSISPSVRISELNTIRDDINSSSVGNSLFENTLNTAKNAFSLQSLQSQNNSDLGRMNNDLLTKTAQVQKLSARLEELMCKLKIAELHRDKAKQEAVEWKERHDLVQIQLNLPGELRDLSIQKLKQLQSKLRTDLEEVDKVLYLENAKKCMKCEENNRTVTLEPCNHLSICNTCAGSVTECPYCQVPVITTHT
ncbi:RING finger protein unkempt isoform X1 [Drosophila nasuta]|uniref:RING finger protein unkempt isoform X1 n=1 Tax=Drosophila albomicans TaxID=7291 RepID=A0A6P8XF01_DROAB|nr:RING finger protein unkempt isoform X1 [Drosophila albomicans]XP_060646769.1 RING finger protein unkempt isoform X1 [Drosophila nasuta]